LDLYTSPGNRGVVSGTTKLADWLASKCMHASSIGVVPHARELPVLWATVPHTVENAASEHQP
jgi:hypothetical protein